MDRYRPSYLDSPKSFRLGLLGLLFFITITLGFSSHWIFSTLPHNEAPLLECVLISFIYTSMFLLPFGVTWGWLHHRFPLYKTHNLIFHGAGQLINSIFGFVAGSLLNALWIIYFANDISYTENILETELAITALLCMIGILFINGVYYSRAFLKRSLNAEKRNTEAELRALRAQINPHFLFNSLNSIAALIRCSPAEAESVTVDLADLFRFTLRTGEQPLVSLKEEVEIVNRYLNIEKVRFKDRLNVTVQIPDDLEHVQIPVLTLQSLVENAVKHGVSKREGVHQISLTIQLVDRCLEIECLDTGPGFSEKNFSEILNKGTGLSNIYQRLKLHFGSDVDGAIIKQGIILRFPYKPIFGESI